MLPAISSIRPEEPEYQVHFHKFTTYENPQIFWI